ncbi:hypothetical protein NKDENANG_03626 [Candidatus Entotheonellaceae bacterium PAL068K]
MTDVLVYWKTYRPEKARNETRRWHSNHRVFNDLLAGDRLWVVTSGKSLGRYSERAGYLVAVWPVAQVMQNPGDDPDYPARKYQHRVLINEVEVIHLDQPVCVDHVIRREASDKAVSVGRFLRGPRRLSDEKVRQLRRAAGADMAHQWLTGKKPMTDDDANAVAPEGRTS